MTYVEPYDQLVAKCLFREGRSWCEVADYLRRKYGKVSSRFIERLRLDVRDGNGRAN